MFPGSVSMKNECWLTAPSKCVMLRDRWLGSMKLIGTKIILNCAWVNRKILSAPGIRHSSFIYI